MHPRFVQRYSRLDHYKPAEALAKWSDAATAPMDKSYGGTFACIPARPGYPAWHDYARVGMQRLWDRLDRKIAPHD